MKVLENCRFTGICPGLVMLMVALTGCSHRVYEKVESESVKTDTVVELRRRDVRDSVVIIERILDYRKDSIVPILDTSGRVTGFDRWHFVNREAAGTERRHTDCASTDSVGRVSVREVVIKEVQPVGQGNTSVASRFLTKMGDVLNCVLLIILLLLAVSNLKRRFTK